MAVQKAEPADEDLPWDERGVVLIDVDVSFFTQSPNIPEIEEALSQLGAVRPAAAPAALSLEVAEVESAKATAGLRVYTHPMNDDTKRMHWHINFRRMPPLGAKGSPAGRVSIRQALQVLATAWGAASLDARLETTYFLDLDRYSWRGPQVRPRKVPGLGTIVPTSTSWAAGRNKRGFLGFTATYDTASDSSPFMVEARGAWPIKFGTELLSQVDDRLWSSVRKLWSERKR